MRIPELTRFNLSPLARLLVAAGIVIAGTSGVAAFNSLQPTAADEMTPTQIKVEKHDDRLDKNEADIAETKDRVSQVEQKTDDDTQAIGAVRERVVIVEGKTAAPNPAPATVTVPAAPTPADQLYTALALDAPASILQRATRVREAFAVMNQSIGDASQSGPSWRQCEIEIYALIDAYRTHIGEDQYLGFSKGFEEFSYLATVQISSLSSTRTSSESSRPTTTEFLCPPSSQRARPEVSTWFAEALHQ